MRTGDGQIPLIYCLNTRDGRPFTQLHHIKGIPLKGIDVSSTGLRVRLSRRVCSDAA